MLKLKDDNETTKVEKQLVSTYEPETPKEDFSDMEDLYVSPAIASSEASQNKKKTHVQEEARKENPAVVCASLSR